MPLVISRSRCSPISTPKPKMAPSSPPRASARSSRPAASAGGCRAAGRCRRSARKIGSNFGSSRYSPWVWLLICTPLKPSSLAPRTISRADQSGILRRDRRHADDSGRDAPRRLGEVVVGALRHRLASSTSHSACAPGRGQRQDRLVDPGLVHVPRCAARRGRAAARRIERGALGRAAARRTPTATSCPGRRVPSFTIRR